MKNIKAVKLDKYNADNYREVAFDVYFNEAANNYCFCFETDVVNQYPLEDLLDQYLLSCTEYYGQEVTIGGVQKNIVEVETLSANKENLIRILNLSTIVDKEIINVVYGEYEILVVNYGNSNCVINGKEIHIPIVGYRNDRSGMINFELKYPEVQYKSMFTSGQTYNIEIVNFDENNLKYILLRDGKAKLIYEDSYTQETIEIIFNQDGIEEIKKV
ncbi:MAG: hypothetical protein E7161_05300 [Firmicutes bacterium]|nr:hypothetical protein [Bacillota bacterium]